MGWTGVSVWELPVNKNGKYDVKSYIDNIMSYEGTGRTWNVVKSVMVGSTWYGAVSCTDKERNRTNVFAEVVLTSINKNEFWYKEMSENMGPFKYDCPASILEILSFTDNKYALEWREKCKDTAKYKKFRSNWWKTAKDKTKVSYIKYTFEGKNGPEIAYLNYIRGWYKGKSSNFWSDGYYHYSNRLLNEDNCVFVRPDGTEFILTGPKKP